MKTLNFVETLTFKNEQHKQQTLLQNAVHCENAVTAAQNFPQ